MTDPIRCCVPFCWRKSSRAAADYSEWVCAEHWKGIPKERKRAYTRAKRRWKDGRRPEDQIAADRLWARMKRHAINLALGLR